MKYSEEKTLSKERFAYFYLFASFPYLLPKENSRSLSAESTFMTNFAAAKKRLADEYDLDSDADPYCADVPAGD